MSAKSFILGSSQVNEMDVRVLRYFLTIAREESISGAADFLHITQPTLSRQIKDLEDELGTQLLIRGSRNVTLTESGIFLRNRAEEIISLVDKTEAEMTAPEEIITGHIYIGGGETDAMRITAKAAKELQLKHPQIKYHLFSGNADDVKEKIDKGLLDFGIIVEPADIKKYDFLRLPATDKWGLLMRKDHPLAKKDFIHPKDLWDIPLICSAQSKAFDNIAGWIGINMDELNIVTTYNLLFNASLMVDEGLGCALCLDKLINTSGNSNLCFKPLQPELTVHLDIIWKKYQVFSRAAEAFLKQLKENCTTNS